MSDSHEASGTAASGTDDVDPLDAFMNQIHNQLERERDISRLVELQDAEALSRRQGDRSESCSTCGKTLGVPVVRFV